MLRCAVSCCVWLQASVAPLTDQKQPLASQGSSTTHATNTTAAADPTMDHQSVDNMLDDFDQLLDSMADKEPAAPEAQDPTTKATPH